MEFKTIVSGLICTMNHAIDTKQINNQEIKMAHNEGLLWQSR